MNSGTGPKTSLLSPEAATRFMSLGDGRPPDQAGCPRWHTPRARDRAWRGGAWLAAVVSGLLTANLVLFPPEPPHAEARRGSVGDPRPGVAAVVARAAREDGNPASQEHVMSRNLGKSAVQAAAATVLAATSAASAQNLVSNPGFEQSNYAGDCCPGCGTTVTVPGWEASNVDHLRGNPTTGIPAGEGSRYVDLNQCSPGWVRQAITVVPGRRYRLRFLMTFMNGYSCQQNPREVRVTFGGTVHSITSPGPTDGWASYEFVTTAAATPLTLEFRGINGGCVSGEIDDVLVTEIRCHADLNQDGRVDGSDISALLGFWGPTGTVLPTADINQDGTVNGGDLAQLLAAWGPCP